MSVVSLASTDKKPLIASDKAKAFKSLMHNRGIRRQSGELHLETRLVGLFCEPGDKDPKRLSTRLFSRRLLQKEQRVSVLGILTVFG